jgi:hypothetical protein
MLTGGEVRRRGEPIEPVTGQCGGGGRCAARVVLGAWTRGEWGGDECGEVGVRSSPFYRGVIGAAAARVGGGGSGAQSGFQRKMTAGRLTGRARLSVRRRRRGRLGQKGGRERGGPRLGREGEGERWATTGSKAGNGWIKSVQILFGIWIFWQTLEICTRRFRRNFDTGILPKIF